MPTSLPRFNDRMSVKRPDEPSRNVVIEKNKHGDQRQSGANGIEAARGEVDYGLYLLARNVVLFDDFVDAHAIFQVFENQLDGHASVPENPCAAEFAGNALNAGTLRPIERWHGCLLLSDY